MSRPRFWSSSTGRTTALAPRCRAAGHYACIAPVNRGQGAALRLGYRIAREHGAVCIVTADGDGQTDPDDLEVVLEPVVSGRADFVNGSRRLGQTHGTDATRNTGVVVFAAARLASDRDARHRHREPDPCFPGRATRRAGPRGAAVPGVRVADRGDHARLSFRGTTGHNATAAEAAAPRRAGTSSTAFGTGES